MSLTRRRASSVARRQGGADEVDERTADKMMDDLLADMGPSPGQGEGNGPGVRSVRDLSGLHELDGLQCQSHKQEPLKPDLAARFHQAALWAAYMGMKGLVRMAMLERCSTTQVKPLSLESNGVSIIVHGHMPYRRDCLISIRAHRNPTVDKRMLEGRPGHCPNGSRPG